MQLAQRLQYLQANIFDEMDHAKAQARAAGQKIIDLSLGSSDLPTAPHITGAIAQALQDPSTHGYLLFHGTREFRQAAAQWYEAKFGIAVNPETEVLPLIGSQEGTAHLPLAVLNPGDFALLQDPCYPSHSGGVYLASGQIYPMALKAENGYLPVFTDIPAPVLAQTKMMVLSYPHNPTTAIAPLSFFQEAVDFCRHYDIVLVHDFPYVDLIFQGTAPSVLQADRQKELSIEFFTFSKSYSMGGFRLGYAIGNSQLITALRQVKAMVDFSQYVGILRGGVVALTGDQTGVAQAVATFRERRDAFMGALSRINWLVPQPEATMYIWAKLPEQWRDRSTEFCIKLVKETGVAATPGAGFGESGEGYVRFALVQDPATLDLAVAKIGKFLG